MFMFQLKTREQGRSRQRARGPTRAIGGRGWIRSLNLVRPFSKSGPWLIYPLYGLWNVIIFSSRAWLSVLYLMVSVQLYSWGSLVDYRSWYLPFFFISFSSYVVCPFKKCYLHNACGVSEIICARWHANFSWMPACQLLRWFIAHLIELVLVIGNVFMTT